MPKDSGKELEFLANKTGATRLGCALLLKCFQYEGHFPSARHEIPKDVVNYIANQLKLDVILFTQYDWDGRTIKLHRTQIRDLLKFREATAIDTEEMKTWLLSEKLASDQNLEHLKALVTKRFRDLKIEPPASDRMDRLLNSVCATYEQRFFDEVLNKVPLTTRMQLDDLLARSDPNRGTEMTEEEDQSSSNEGLNVIENWNGANTFIFYGRSSEFASNRLADQELSALSLHVLQICLVYVNTLLIQRVLAEPKQFKQMKKEDLRTLTPLIYSHVTPYGTFRLDLSERIRIEDVLSA